MFSKYENTEGTRTAVAHFLPGGYSHIKRTWLLVENFEKTPRGTQILSCGRGMKFFSPPRGTSSKTTCFGTFILFNCDNDDCFEYFDGGGVGFYIKSSLSYTVHTDLNAINLENLTIEIRKPNSKPFLVATLYRPPCSPTDLFSSYESFKGKLDSLDLEYYLLGDLNCNLASSTPVVNTRRLLEISDLYGLKQLINEPTRVTESASTLIDLISVNYPDRVGCSGVSHIAISDHSLVYAYRKLSSDLPSKRHSSISYRNFRNEISQQEWSFDKS